MTRRRLLILGLTPVVIYVGIVILMAWMENRLVYRPTPASAGWVPKPDPSIEDVWFKTAAGEDIHAWYLRRQDAVGVILVCHGNGGNLSGRGSTMVRFAEELNRSILIFDYPGYGKSPGKPSEAKCYLAAEAAHRWLVGETRAEPTQVVLYGESLGGGVAVELATRHEHEALVLMKTFTSLPDVAGRMYPWLPVRWLMSNRFDSLAKIARCHRPVLVVGATDDSLVPYPLSQKLYSAANAPKRFIALEGDDHNDPLPGTFLPAMGQFLSEPGESKN